MSHDETINRSPLDDDNFDLEAWKAQKQESYEETILKKIMKRFDIQSRIADLKRRCHEVTGVYSLNLDWFFDEYPSFPVRLITRSIPYVHQITVVDFFKGFKKTRLFADFEDAILTFGIDLEEKPIAMIFNWPGLGSMAFHNYKVNWDTTDTRLIKLCKFMSPNQTFVLETLGAFLDCVAETWQP